MKILRKLIIFNIVVVLFSGCAQLRIIEELGFMHSLGYELNEAKEAQKEGILVITAVFPQLAPTADVDREILTTIANTSKEGRSKLSRKTNRILVSGQLRTALFSKNLADIGILDTIDTLQRDHTIGLNLKIITVNGSTKELLLGEYPYHPRTDRYIYELIEKDSQNHVTVDTSLHDFVRDYHDDGIDPITPVLKKGKEEIIIDGIGLFKDDRLVHTIDPKASRIFKMLHGDYLGGDITTEIHLKEEKKDRYLFITYNTLESSRRVTVNSPSHLQIHLEVKGSIEEYTGLLELSDDEVQKEIEEKLAEFIKNNADELIKVMQQLKTDNLGLGQFVRNRSTYHQWRKMNWKEEIFPEATVDVFVRVKLKGFGSVK